MHPVHLKKNENEFKPSTKWLEIKKNNNRSTAQRVVWPDFYFSGKRADRCLRDGFATVRENKRWLYVLLMYFGIGPALYLWRLQHLSAESEDIIAMRSQNAVTVYYSSKQLLPLGFARHNTGLWLNIHLFTAPLSH